jgi:hypothetical protein
MDPEAHRHGDQEQGEQSLQRDHGDHLGEPGADSSPEER